MIGDDGFVGGIHVLFHRRFETADIFSDSFAELGQRRLPSLYQRRAIPARSPAFLPEWFGPHSHQVSNVKPEQIQPHNACELMERVAVAQTLSRFFRRQTKLDNCSELPPRSRLQRSAKARWYVKLDHLCHDNLLDLSTSNSPSNPSASATQGIAQPKLVQKRFMNRA